jgi:hypothetical protein
VGIADVSPPHFCLNLPERRQVSKLTSGRALFESRADQLYKTNPFEVFFA